MRKIVHLESGRETRRLERIRDDLPPQSTKRWVASRKAAVVNAVAAGAIGVEEACARYSLSIEELNQWRDSLGEYGVHALLVTKLQRYRHGSQSDEEPEAG